MISDQKTKEIPPKNDRPAPHKSYKKDMRHLGALQNTDGDFRHEITRTTKPPKPTLADAIEAVQTTRDAKVWIDKTKPDVIREKAEHNAELETLSGELFRYLSPDRQPKVRCNEVESDNSIHVLYEEISGFIHLYKAQKTLDEKEYHAKIYNARADLAEILIIAIFLNEIDLKLANICFDVLGRIIKIDNEYCLSQIFNSFVSNPLKNAYEHVPSALDLEMPLTLTHFNPDNWLWSRLGGEKQFLTQEKIGFIDQLKNNPDLRTRINRMLLKIITLPDSFFVEICKCYIKNPLLASYVSDMLIKNRKNLEKAALLNENFQQYLSSDRSAVDIKNTVAKSKKFVTMGKYVLWDHIPDIEAHVLEYRNTLCKKLQAELPDYQFINFAQKKNFNDAAKHLEKFPTIDINTDVDPTGNRAIHYALKADDKNQNDAVTKDFVKLLCEKHKADLSKENRRGHTALSVAAEEKQYDVLNYFIDSPKLLQQFSAKQVGRALHALVEKREYKLADALLQKRPDADVTQFWDYKTGDTVLHTLAKEGKVELITTLCKTHNTQFNHMNNNDHTPLSLAIESKQYDVVKYFLSNDEVVRNLTQPQLHHSLSLLSEHKEDGLIDSLLKKRPDTHPKETQGLYFSDPKRRAEKLSLVTNNNINTLFFELIINKKYNHAELLMRMPYQIDIYALRETQSRNTILHALAEDKKCFALFKALCHQYKAKVASENSKNQTFLEVAAEKENHEAVAYVIYCSAYMNALSPDQILRVLNILAKQKQETFIKAIFEKRPDVLLHLKFPSPLVDLISRNSNLAKLLPEKLASKLLFALVTSKNYSLAARFLHSRPRINTHFFCSKDEKNHASHIVIRDKCDIQFIKDLYEKHTVDSGIENIAGHTAFSLAAEVKHDDAIKYFISKASIINQLSAKQLCSASIILGKYPDQSFATQLIEKWEFESVNKYTEAKTNRKILHIAIAENCHLQFITTLCEVLQVDLRAKDAKGDNCLKTAMDHKNYPVIKYFLENHANKFLWHEIKPAIEFLANEPADEKINLNQNPERKIISYTQQFTTDRNQHIFQAADKIIEEAKSAPVVLRLIDQLEKECKTLKTDNCGCITFNRWKGEAVSNAWVTLIESAKRRINTFAKVQPEDPATVRFLNAPTSFWAGIFYTPPISATVPLSIMRPSPLVQKYKI